MSMTATATCTKATTRCADARDYSHALAPCCRAHVRELVEAVATTLTDAGITWWADYGTLLGAVRNPMTTGADYPWLDLGPLPLAPGIIPHDKDADLGVLHKDWTATWRQMQRLALREKFLLTVAAGRGSMKLRLSRANHTNVDLFFWLEKPDGLLYRRGYAQVDAFKGRHFHKSLLLPLTSVPWEDMTLPAPRDPEAFLEMRYGADWRVPIAANNDGVQR